jgi:hypothetical protein
MAGRTIAHTFFASSLIAVALFMGNAPRSVPPVLAATTTTINFDDLAPGTSVTNQYHAQGVDFTGDIVPFIDQVDPSLAASGNQVADISQCAGCEFFTPNVQGTLVNAAQNVSVRVGYFANSSSPGDTAAITLTALDSGGGTITTDTQTVTEGQGFHTLLSVSSASANIVSFQISGAPNVDTDKLLGIDDLTFDNPAGVPPDFSLSPAASLVNVNQGGSATDDITINRFNGSTGDLTFSAGNLPTGITATFSPNPATDKTTMTIKADPSVQPTGNNPPMITVKATPGSASAGPALRSVQIAIQVKLSFYIELGVANFDIPPCSSSGVKVGVVFNPGFTDNVSLSVSGLPAHVTGTFDPSVVGPPNDGGLVSYSTLTLSVDTDLMGPVGSMTVTGKSGPLTSSGQSTISLTPRISSVTPVGGRTPQALQGGTEVIVTGKGLCPGAQQLVFGNQQAELTPIPVAPGGTQLQAIVPRLATTGKVYAIPVGGNLNSPGTAVSSDSFTVDSYRNTDGFSFDNSPAFQDRVGDWSFGDISDIFGYDQTHYSVNPCWPFGDCSISTPIPTVGALAFWGLVNAIPWSGHCFGFVLASQRLLHGDRHYSDFPLQPGKISTTIWNLQGPDALDGTPGASKEIAHYIHLMHIEQLSAEFMNYWLGETEHNTAFGSQGSIIGDVSSALSQGDHPIVTLVNGGITGFANGEVHAVVAYDVEDGANGDKIIDVYHPNREFKTSEDTDATGTVHQSAVAGSQITVHSDGHWVFPGFYPAWHGGPGSLVVVPYGTPPVHPTMPFSLTGLATFIFGAASASQVTNASGHALLNPDGTVNNNPSTGIPDAARFGTITGSTKPGPDIFLFGKAGAYTQTIAGKGSGQYHDSFLGHGVAASLTAGSVAGSVDKVSLLRNLAGLQFGQVSATKSAGPRQVKTQILVHASDGSERTAAIGTTMATAGGDSVSFDSGRNTVTMKAGGKPVTYSLTLSWAGPHGLPQTFLTPKETISPHASASLTPANWSSLQNAALNMKVVAKNGTVKTSKISNQLRPAGRYSIRLNVVKNKPRVRRLIIATTFKRFVKGSSALFTWEILKGTSLVSSHSKALRGAKLHRGLVKAGFVFKTVAGSHYTLKGSVALFSPTQMSSFLSQTATKQKSFSG